MRSISVVQKIEVDYKGSVFQNAVCFTDVDNDGYNELCVCNTSGDLHVFKGTSSSKPWKVNKNMGFVVVLCGGKVRDTEENLLCSLDTEGTCHLFDVYNENKVKLGQEMGSYKSLGRATSPSRAGELRLIHREKLSPNAKVAILEDIDNDGLAELIVGYTDRFVRIYKWKLKEENLQDEKFIPAQVPVTHKNSLTKQGSKEKSNGTPMLKSDSIESVDSGIRASGLNRSPSSCNHGCGSFVLVKQFSLLAQIGSIAVCKTVEGGNQLIVAQPNGGYCILGVYDNEKGFSEASDTPTSLDSPTLTTCESYPAFYPISCCRSRTNCHTGTEIIGGICRQNKVTGVMGICAQDGSFMILDNMTSSFSNPVKNKSEHCWFSMSKIDVNDNGDDEIVLCSNNGMTYIVDKNRDIVSFNFNENVAAFQAGYFGSEDKTSAPCLCYVTLTGKIFLYHHFWITHMKVKCVHGALIQKLQQREDLKHILGMFKKPNGEIDHQKIQNVVKHIWSEKS